MMDEKYYFKINLRVNNIKTNKIQGDEMNTQIKSTPIRGIIPPHIATKNSFAINKNENYKKKSCKVSKL